MLTDLDTGVAGAITGAGAAIMSDASPFISGTSTGLHWASVGTTYWCTNHCLQRSDH